VARLPLVASGHAGAPQLDALARVLQHPVVRGRTPVILSHHAVTRPRGAVGAALRGCSAAGALRAALASGRAALAFHGHLRRRVHERIAAGEGATIHRLGATSASFLADDPRAMAGYNGYEVSAASLARAGAPGLRARGEGLRRAGDPRGLARSR